MLYGDAGDKFWEVAKTGDYMVGDNYSCEVVSATGGAGVETNVLKLTSTGLASGKSNMRFSLRSKYTEPVAGKQSGGVTLDPNKLYELTGWVMAEKTGTGDGGKTALHNGWMVRNYYYAKGSSGKYTNFGDATTATSVTHLERQERGSGLDLFCNKSFGQQRAFRLFHASPASHRGQ